MYHTMYRILNWNISLNFFDICLFQDISDDILLGIKSTAIKFKEHTKYWLTGFSAIMTSGLTIGGIMVDQTWPYYSAVALVASHLVWQVTARR